MVDCGTWQGYLGACMILALTVNDVATIESCALVIGRGLTVMTGETGAGKSLLVDAIGLALGGRADADLVRTGARKAVVSLSASVTDLPEVVSLCASHGIDVPDGEIVVVREVSAEGRSTVRINGRLTTVACLRSIGQLLVDLHGQHEHQALMAVENQILFLDQWVGESALALVASNASLYSSLESTRRRLAVLRADRRDVEKRLDMLRFQVSEIEGVAPVVGEFDALESRMLRLQNVERLALAAGESLAGLSDADGAVLDGMRAALHALEGGEALDHGLAVVVDPLKGSLYSLEDAVSGLRAYVEALDTDPRALEECAARLDALKRLRKKYGEDEAAVLGYLSGVASELSSIEEGGASEEELVSLASSQEIALQETAGRLTQLRIAKAREFAEQVTRHAKELAMEHAEFEVRISPQPIQANGADSVEFYFTANPGDPPRALAKVASGGEISRVMLAIKVSSAGRAGVPTLVFDEIDAGLSGRAAAVTATKLRRLAEHYQVLVISHLPQIAGRADTHFRIEKGAKRGRSHTEVNHLEGDDRVREVARMLAGEKVGDSALANAKELIG